MARAPSRAALAWLWAEVPLPIPTGSRQMATNNTDNEKRRIPRS